jgi:adenine-specific DNA-methyltransferase
MSPANHYEQQFLDALKDIFVGAKVEGDSGYINLMRIKSRYYTEGVFPQLMKDIDVACKPFEPAFREELFDKLYDFFKRYFSDSGSIYFCHTPQHANVYEKVYTDERDVMLFWKTHMLYYVKTDRLFNSLDVEIDGSQFYFDALEMEYKRSNEKRELLYTLKDYKSGKVMLGVAYSEKNRKTKSDEIIKGLKAKAINLDEETLDKAIRVFEKQSEVDYFINKNAGAFLKEQFDLWMYQYIFIAQSDFDEKRLKQLQAIKLIANKIIDFIAQFEDELVRVWNKPKFVLNSHYVITLDKITNADLRKKLFAHAGMKDQIKEWRDLGITGDGFNVKALTEQHQFLPLDTRYFPDLELDILAQFDDLDAALDGWLIHSENYQALNTMLPKYRSRVKCIYIDPPYNSESSEIIYVNNYKSSSWLSVMQDRLQISKQYLADDGMIGIAIDDFEFTNLTHLVSDIFTIVGKAVVRSNPAGRSTSKGFSLNHEYAVFASRSGPLAVGYSERNQKQIERYKEEDKLGKFEWVNFRKHGGLRSESYPMYYPIYVSKEGGIRVPKMSWNSSKNEWDVLEPKRKQETELYPIDENGQERRWKWSLKRLIDNPQETKLDVDKDGDLAVYIKSRMPKGGIVPGTWWDYKLYSATDWGAKVLKDLFGEHGTFSYPKAPKLVEKCLQTMNYEEADTVIDYFAGSGTTAHTVINLNRLDDGRRKYVLVELGEHFETVILPRIKKLTYSENWKNGAAQPGKGISHFIKYFDLEQYEDALRHANYQDSDMFATADAYNSYVFMRDTKMLGAISLNKPANKVNVDLGKLYSGIDLAETLSCVTGKGIKRITKQAVEFQDGTTSSLTDPDWELIKPLVWW